MSCVMRKPDFCICKNKGVDQLHGYVQIQRGGQGVRTPLDFLGYWFCNGKTLIVRPILVRVLQCQNCIGPPSEKIFWVRVADQHTKNDGIMPLLPKFRISSL